MLTRGPVSDGAPTKGEIAEAQTICLALREAFA
jgi:hypothetical protein